jgi:hypothetical protein
MLFFIKNFQSRIFTRKFEKSPSPLYGKGEEGVKGYCRQLTA